MVIRYIVRPGGTALGGDKMSVPEFIDELLQRAGTMDQAPVRPLHRVAPKGGQHDAIRIAGREKADHTSARATTAPVTGVTSRREEVSRTSSMICRAMDVN